MLYCIALPARPGAGPRPASRGWAADTRQPNRRRQCNLSYRIVSYFISYCAVLYCILLHCLVLYYLTLSTAHARRRRGPRKMRRRCSGVQASLVNF